MSEYTDRLAKKPWIDERALVAEIDRLEKELASAIDECRTISAQRDLVHHELRELKAEVERLEGKNATERLMAKGLIGKLHADRERLETRNASLASQIGRMVADVSRAEELKKIITADNEALTGEVGRLEEENAKFRGKAETDERTLKWFDTIEVPRLRAEVEQLKAQVNAEAGRNLDNDKRLTGYEAEIERLRAALKVAEDHIGAIAELDPMSVSFALIAKFIPTGARTALAAIDRELGK